MTGTQVPNKARAWRGRAVTQAREYMLKTKRWPAKCGQGCGVKVYKEDNWVVGHIKPRAIYPELTWEPSNWRIEHRKCSDATGQAVVIEKAKHEAIREITRTNPQIIEQTSSFSPTQRPPEPPPLPASLPEGLDADGIDAEGSVRAVDGLSWDPGYLAQFEWLRPLLDVPDDASVPMMMSPVPVDAVCSFGWDGCTHLPDGEPDAVSWMEQEMGMVFRWWQRLSAVRQLEHRADGSLCFEKKDESAPRRAGKSVGLRGGALWRLEFGQRLFGEPQTAIHTGSDMAICRDIQMKAWRWAEARGWTVTRGNGKEAIQTPADDRWLVRAQDAVYGYDLMYGIIDEGWDVKPDVLTEGLEPATLERSSPQIVLTSTAHRRATSLMRSELANAMTGEDPATLLLLWAADPYAPGYNPGDPRIWKAASPHWSEARRKLIEAKYLKALNGEQDPEFDDPDPMKGFEAQYLNIWRIRAVRTVGSPVIEEEAWSDLRAVPPKAAPSSVAVESWFDAGVSVAQAWKLTGGKVAVRVDDYDSLEDAAQAVRDLGFRRPIRVGTSLAEAAVWRQKGLRVKSASATVTTQVHELIRLLGEDRLVHDESPALTEQVTAVRISPGVNGPRLRSTERADGLKAAMWAATEALNAPAPGKVNTIITVDW